MASKQLKLMNELYASIKELMSKWMPAAYRHCGVSRRAAIRTASCYTATPVAQSLPRCTPTERRLGTSRRQWVSAPSC